MTAIWMFPLVDKGTLTLIMLQLGILGLAFFVGYFVGNKKNSGSIGNETGSESVPRVTSQDAEDDDVRMAVKIPRVIRDRELALHRVDKYEHLIERAKRSLLNIIGVCSHTEQGWKDLNKHLKDAHKGKGKNSASNRQDNGHNELWVKHDNVGEGIQIKAHALLPCHPDEVVAYLIKSDQTTGLEGIAYSTEVLECMQVENYEEHNFNSLVNEFGYATLSQTIRRLKSSGGDRKSLNVMTKNRDFVVLTAHLAEGDNVNNSSNSDNKDNCMSGGSNDRYQIFVSASLEDGNNNEEYKFSAPPTPVGNTFTSPEGMPAAGGGERGIDCTGSGSEGDYRTTTAAPDGEAFATMNSNTAIGGDVNAASIVSGNNSDAVLIAATMASDDTVKPTEDGVMIDGDNNINVSGSHSPPRSGGSAGNGNGNGLKVDTSMSPSPAPRSPYASRSNSIIDTDLSMLSTTSLNTLYSNPSVSGGVEEGVLLRDVPNPTGAAPPPAGMPPSTVIRTYKGNSNASTPSLSITGSNSKNGSSSSPSKFLSPSSTPTRRMSRGLGKNKKIRGQVTCSGYVVLPYFQDSVAMTLVLFGGQIDMKNQSGTFKTSMKNQSTLEPLAESIRDTLNNMRLHCCQGIDSLVGNGGNGGDKHLSTSSMTSIASTMTSASNHSNNSSNSNSNSSIATLPASSAMKTFSDRFPQESREVYRTGQHPLPVTLVSVFNTEEEVLLSEDSCPEKAHNSKGNGNNNGQSGLKRSLHRGLHRGLSLLNIPTLPGSDICVEWFQQSGQRLAYVALLNFMDYIGMDRGLLGDTIFDHCAGVLQRENIDDASTTNSTTTSSGKIIHPPIQPHLHSLPWKHGLTKQKVVCSTTKVTGSVWDAIKATCVVKCTKQELLMLLCDDTRVGTFDEMFDKNSFISKINEYTTVRRQAFKAVWPTSPRDFVVCTSWAGEFHNDLPAIQCSKSATNELYPSRDPWIRGNLQAHGYFIEPYESMSFEEREKTKSKYDNAFGIGMCRLTFLNHGELEGSLPASIINSLATSAPLKLMRGIERVILKDRRKKGE